MHENFIQIDIKIPKKDSERVNEFFFHSGALSSSETLYQENLTHNLDNDYTWLQFAFPEKFPVEAVTIMGMELLSITDYEHKIKTILTKDIIQAMKKNLRPFDIANTFTLFPSYKEALQFENKEKNVIIINPAFAFGTGQHETSRLMIEYLENNVKPGMYIIDLGCGSGILSIASLILGAIKVIGIDIENLSVKASLENKALNRSFYEKFSANLSYPLQWDYLEFHQDDFSWYKNFEKNSTGIKSQKMDIFIANILPGVFQKNEEDLSWYLAHADNWALSGIYGKAFDQFFPWLKNLEPVKKRNLSILEKNGWYVIYTNES